MIRGCGMWAEQDASETVWIDEKNSASERYLSDIIVPA